MASFDEDLHRMFGKSQGDPDSLDEIMDMCAEDDVVHNIDPSIYKEEKDGDSDNKSRP